MVGVPSQTSYCATKFAVRGFSEALWIELKEHNIGVTSVHPGGVRTDIARSARTADDELKSSAIGIIEKNSVSPERCAGLIVSAIKKNKRRQLVTGVSHVIDWAERVAPGLPERLLQSGYSRGVMRSSKPPAK
jgi:short-subunit dehydrogenase